MDNIGSPKFDINGKVREKRYLKVENHLEDRNIYLVVDEGNRNRYSTMLLLKLSPNRTS